MLDTTRDKDVLEGLPSIEIMIRQLKIDQIQRVKMMNKDPEIKRWMPKSILSQEDMNDAKESHLINEIKCNFHTTSEWRDGKIDNICLFVKNEVKCDGESRNCLISCPLWGEFV